MGLYNVVGPCLVNNLHYIRPTTEPIEVDDAEAAPLVEAGSLEPYSPGVLGQAVDSVLEGLAPLVDSIEAAEVDDEPPTIPPPPRKPRGRRSEG